MVLEDDVVTSYYQDETGKWLATTRNPIAEDCVAFDLEGMLKAGSELTPYMTPAQDPGANYPLYPEEYGSVSLAFMTEQWVFDPDKEGFDDTHDVVFAGFSNYPEYGHKLNGIFRNPFYVSRFVEEETDWVGKDAFLDYLCEIDNTFSFVGVIMDQEDYGKVEVELPDRIENAEMVDDFQFMTTEFKEALIAHFEKLETEE